MFLTYFSFGNTEAIHKVRTITSTGLQHSFYGNNIVLCAGAIDSPALLLRSNIELTDKKGKAKKGEGEQAEKKGKGKEKDEKTGIQKEEKKEERKEEEAQITEEDKEVIEKTTAPKYPGITDHNIYGFRFTIQSMLKC